MGWKEFAASVIGDVLSWPVVFLVTVLLLLKPLRRLIGRIRSFKGWGADVQLAEELKKIEENAVEAVDEVAEEDEDPDEDSDVALGGALPPAGAESNDPSPRQLGSLPTDTTVSEAQTATEHPADRHNARVRALLDRARQRASAASIFDPPSLALEDPSGAVIRAWENLVETLDELNQATRGRGRPTSNPRLIINQLSRNGIVTESFVETVEGLMKVRNEVAHGVTAPSRNAARTYWRTAEQMRSLAANILDDLRPTIRNSEPSAEGA